jgi:uncharacterized protein
MPNTPSASGHSAAHGPLSYGTPDEPRLAVRGAASLEFDPEIANIGVNVRARGTDRRQALESLTRRNSEVLELIKSYGESVEKLSTGSLSVTPELVEKSKRERVRTYNGRVHISATVSDFTALGEMITQLADLELTDVVGPWWALRKDSPAHREARQQAVRAAVTRAREYAQALDAELVALLELSDVGADSSPVPAAPAGAGGRMRQSYGGGGAPAMDLEPQRQSVYAQVNARFLMSRPVL